MERVDGNAASTSPAKLARKDSFHVGGGWEASPADDVSVGLDDIAAVDDLCLSVGSGWKLNDNSRKSTTRHHPYKRDFQTVTRSQSRIGLSEHTGRSSTSTNDHPESTEQRNDFEAEFRSYNQGPKPCAGGVSQEYKEINGGQQEFEELTLGPGRPSANNFEKFRIK
jgi:hypothetical protein